MADGGVGSKSCLLHRFITGDFLTVYDPTVEDRKTQTVKLDETELVIEFIDTAGVDEFANIRRYIHRSHCYP